MYMCYVVLNVHVLCGVKCTCVCYIVSQGWSSAYTIEAVIMQIQATLVKGKGRIVFSHIKVVRGKEIFISFSTKNTL